MRTMVQVLVVARARMMVVALVLVRTMALMLVAAMVVALVQVLVVRTRACVCGAVCGDDVCGVCQRLYYCVAHAVRM